MKDFDNIFKDKLSSYKAEPPKEAFNNIRQNYPKQSFKNFIYNNKAITSISVLSIIIISTILIYNSNTDSNFDNNQLINNIINPSSQPDPIISNDSTLNSNTTIINSINKTQNCQIKNTQANNYNSDNIPKQHIDCQAVVNIFNTKDTLSCTNTFTINKTFDYKYLKLPSRIKMKVNNNSIILTAESKGQYVIYYDDNKVLDSININFDYLDNKDVLVSKDFLCSNDKLEIKVNNLYKVLWSNNNADIELSGNKYIISHLKEGNNLVQFTVYNNLCNHDIVKKVYVHPSTQYQVSTSANICSKSNGSISILTQTNKDIKYILNEQRSNSTGFFNNLKSGIHYLKIIDNNNCIYNDTIFLFDSINIMPLFTSTCDAYNKHLYYFQNKTKIDNSSYEDKSNVKFIWKINNIEQSTHANMELELTSKVNQIELSVILNENCIASYSKTIVIENDILIVPNVFTPNADGICDLFEINYAGELKSYKILISNRAGEVVFESTNISQSWDGKINGNNDASEGIYFYLIQANDKKGNPIFQKGTLNLIR